MRKLVLFVGFLLSLTTLPAAAQYYQLAFLDEGRNPGDLNQDTEVPAVGGGLPAGWTILLTGTTATYTTPVWSPNATLPFAFSFAGQPVTEFKASTSGVLTFTTSATAVPGIPRAALPSTQIPDKSVCVWGMAANSGDWIITKTFGTAPNRQFWVQFNSFSSPSSSTVYAYWSIVLEETTNNIYIVDQRSNTNSGLGLSAGVQVDGSTAFSVLGSPSLNSRGVGDPSAADNSYWQFSPGTQPTRDMAMSSLDMPLLVGRRTNVSIKGTVRNLGSQAVTSYAVNYKVNNAAPVSAPITGVSIPAMGSNSFTHPTAWRPGASGTYNLKIWVSNPNAQPDQVPANDTLRLTVVAKDSVIDRLVVFEGFTSSTCNPCRPGNANLVNVNVANKGKYVQVKYQQNFPAPGNDPYYTAEAGTRLRYYQTGGTVSIPFFAVDGGYNSNFAGNSNSYVQTDFERARSRPSIVKAEGSYTRKSTTIRAYTSFTALDAITSTNLVAHVIITERRTTLNTRTNGESLFYDVAKKMLPDQSGTPVPPLTQGQTFVLPVLTYTFPAPTLPVTADYVENFDSLRVVVFLQDRVTKEIFQGAYSVLNGPLAAKDHTAGVPFAVVPNPTAGRSSLWLTLERPETAQLEVLDALGRRVLHQPTLALRAGSQSVPLDLGGHAAGVYVVRLTTSQGSRTERLILE